MTSSHSFIDQSNKSQQTRERTLNILFLDIDGVLNRGPRTDPNLMARISNGEVAKLKARLALEKNISADDLNNVSDTDFAAFMGYLPEAVDCLRQLCKEQDIKIVMSSTFRVNRKLQQLTTLLAVHDLEGALLDVTPRLADNRGQEIELWLLENIQRVKSFVILDDVPLQVSDYFPDRFVHCDTPLNPHLTEQAKTIIRTPFNFTNPPAKLRLEAIARNAPQVTAATFDTSDAVTLMLCYQCDAETLHQKILGALKNNTHLTHLALRGICQSFNQSTELVINLAELLNLHELPLTHLDLSNNNIMNIRALISVINGIDLHIPNIIFQDGLIGNCDYLAKWLATYPQPLKLDIGNMLLTETVITALLNPNCKATIRIYEESRQDNMSDALQIQLIQAGRLELYQRHAPSTRNTL